MRICKSSVILIVVAVLISTIGGSVAASTPSLMNYQGRLTDPSGNPLTGSFPLVFTIYDDSLLSAPGNIKWQEFHGAVQVNDGLFSVILGSGTPPVPLTDGVFSGVARYLGIKVAGDPEIVPRTRLVSTSYSLRVNTLDGSRGGNVTDTIRMMYPNGLVGIEMYSQVDKGVVKFYEPVSVIPPLRTVSQPLRVELSDSAFFMFPFVHSAQPIDTNISITSDGNVRSKGRISVGDTAVASGLSTAAFGSSNIAFGDYSIVAGGKSNLAQARYSGAAGQRAKAIHEGSFVWSDATPADQYSPAVNTYTVRAANGLILPANADTASNVPIGSHFRDNGIVAWGKVSAAGSAGTDFFGLASVSASVVDSSYTITLDASAATANELIPLACIVVSAAPTSPSLARLIYVHQTAVNQFKVYITNGNYVKTFNDFVFMVTAR